MAGTWSIAAPMDAGHAVTSVSCVSTTFCMAVDDGGRAVTYDGSQWSPPSLIDVGAVLTSVSCVQGPLCMAVDSSGQALSYTGSWSIPLIIDAGNSLTGGSCASASFCVAAGNGALGPGVVALLYDLHGWSNSDFLGVDGLTSVSCLSAIFCVVGDNYGRAYFFDGAAWARRAIDKPHAVTSVSCVSPDFCMAVTDFGDALFSVDGLQWTEPLAIDPDTALTSVSCTSTSFCIAVDAVGRAFAHTGPGWNAPVVIDPGTALESVSCTSASFCLAVDNQGNYLRFDGSPAGGGSGSQPGSYQLAGFASPRSGSSWTAGSTIPVTATLHYPGGPAIPASLTQMLAASCAVTVSATGAQGLSRHCMRYDSSTRGLIYRWRLAASRTGAVRLQMRLTWRAVSTIAEPLTIRPSGARVQSWPCWPAGDGAGMTACWARNPSRHTEQP